MKNSCKKRTRENEVTDMEMKNKVLDYIETCGISVEYLSKVLQIDFQKFQRDSNEDWEAQELLQICTYLKVDPLDFYTPKIVQEGEKNKW